MADKASSSTLILDAYTPKQIAERVQKVGVTKGNLEFWTMFALAILAGSFIGLGAEFCTLVITGSGLGYGLTKLIGGLVFSLGLILVVVAGAELFTGNNLLTIAWLGGEVPFRRVLRNWVTVFAGNLVGSLALAGLMFLTRQWVASDYAVGVTAIRIAADKVALPFWTALMRGILCNALVCLAVWLCSGARSVADKILAIVFPITAFVASSFEHSIANMYFVPYGMLLNTQPAMVEAATAAGVTAEQLGRLTVVGFFNNLIPVTIGNVIGGAVMVGMMYWFIYLRDAQKEKAAVQAEPASVPVPVPLALQESYAMATVTPDSNRLALFGYIVASADMFYSEVNQRMIYLDGIEKGALRVVAETPAVGGASAVNLSNILLEYAMSSKAQGDLTQAYRQMDAFGKRLGEMIAVQVIRAMPAETPARKAALALECVFTSLNVPYSVDETDNELRYSLDLCPLCAVEEQTGLGEVELGHHGLSALCRSLVRALGPELGIRLPAAPHSDHLFAVTRPLEPVTVRY